MGVRQIKKIFFSRRCGQARMRLFASTVAYFVSPAERLLRRNKPSGSGACDGGGPPALPAKFFGPGACLRCSAAPLPPAPNPCAPAAQGLRRRPHGRRRVGPARLPCGALEFGLRLTLDGPRSSAVRFPFRKFLTRNINRNLFKGLAIYHFYIQNIFLQKQPNHKPMRRINFSEPGLL